MLFFTNDFFNDKQIALLRKAKDFAISKHNLTNCTYAGEPYSVHLEHVVTVAEEIFDSIEDGFTESQILIILQASWLHDVIEDCRVSYGEVKDNFGVEVADIVFNISNERGKNRKDRAIRTYPKIASCPLSTFVKVCDRIANTEFSKTSGHGMYEKYISEYPLFKEALYPTDRKLNSDEKAAWNRLEACNIQ